MLPATRVRRPVRHRRRLRRRRTRLRRRCRGRRLARVAGSSVTLAWAASTDNVGVARYRVYRSTTSGFTPAAANQIGDADVGGVHGLGSCCGDVLLQGDGGGCCRQHERRVRSGIGDGCCGATADRARRCATGSTRTAGTAVVDASGNANNGTTGQLRRWAAGKFGSALSFNGTSSRVTVPDSNTLDLTRASTIEAWVRPTALSGWATVVLKERTGGMVYSLYANNAVQRAPSASCGRAPSRMRPARASSPSTCGRISPPAGMAQPCACTLNGTAGRVDGGERSTLAASTGPLSIGGNRIWGEYFKGLIDEVRLYDRAL